jgi:plastocyanin
LLKLTGGGAGIAALGGVSVLGAGQEDDETDTGGNGTQTDGDESAGDDSVVLDDLIDPTFGYPLAADESDGVELEHVVEGSVVEGTGAHENFPSEPDEAGMPVETPVEFPFDPVGIQVTPDDVVQFRSTAGLHTVTAFDEKYGEPGFAIPNRTPDGAPGFSSPPIVAGESWLYQFPETGVYDILCLPHYGLGMVMRVVVFDPETDDIADEQFTVAPPEGVPPNDTAVLTAPELNPENIVEQGSVAWADLTLGDTSTETPDGTPTEGGETATPDTGGTETTTPGTSTPETSTPETTTPETSTPGSGENDTGS